MAGLRFPLAELERETEAMKAIARKFFESSAEWVLGRFLENLRSIGSTGERKQTLKLRSLHTRSSKDYEPGKRQGGQNVRAVISGIWDLQPAGPKSNRQIEFCGIASTRIELHTSDKDEPSRCLGMWRMELGAEDSPGCYFHAQILGDSDEPPFPKSVPIPRLPSFFVTPMSAVEFVLGELFQDEWAKATNRKSGEMPYWYKLQKQRLERLFLWYQECLPNSISSPWMALKAAKPEGDMFLSNKFPKHLPKR